MDVWVFGLPKVYIFLLSSSLCPGGYLGFYRALLDGVRGSASGDGG